MQVCWPHVGSACAHLHHWLLGKKCVQQPKLLAVSISCACWSALAWLGSCLWPQLLCRRQRLPWMWLLQLLIVLLLVDTGLHGCWQWPITQWGGRCVDSMLMWPCVVLVVQVADVLGTCHAC